MEFGALWESHLLDGDPRFEQLAGGQRQRSTRRSPSTTRMPGCGPKRWHCWMLTATASPLRDYYRGWIFAQSGQREAAAAAFAQAAAQPVDLCFPNRLDDVLALEAAMQR